MFNILTDAMTGKEELNVTRGNLSIYHIPYFQPFQTSRLTV